MAGARLSQGDSRRRYEEVLVRGLDREDGTKVARKMNTRDNGCDLMPQPGDNMQKTSVGSIIE